MADDPLGAALSDADIARTSVPTIVKVAAAIWGFEGFLLLVFALQQFMVSWPGALGVVPYVIVGAGVVSLLVAIWLYKLRRWSVALAMPWGIAAALLTIGWFVTCLTMGVVSLVGLIVCTGAVGGFVLTTISLPRARVVLATRAKLRRDGLEFGF